MDGVNFDRLMAPMFWSIVFGVFPGFLILLFNPQTNSKWCYWAMKFLVWQGVIVAILWNSIWVYLVLVQLKG